MKSYEEVIIFIGPISPPDSIPTGGYESANRHTIDNLNAKNFKVIEFPYPLVHGNTLQKTLLYFMGFSATIFRLTIFSILNLSNPTVFHITGLYKHFIYIELWFVIIARIFRKPVIYEIRAGSMLDYYRDKTFLYRTVLDRKSVV